jgi:hypothetical protein
MIRKFIILKKFLIGTLAFFCFTPHLQAQFKQTQFNGFGHIEYSLMAKDSVESYFSIGEHDFFVTSNISKQISFLGEFVIRYNSTVATNFLSSIERAFVKFNYRNNHSIIAGKIHTPLSFWNDTYHHGRVFFPVIDRPFAFTYIVPLHTLGTQFQGQNIGDLGFGYDLVLGNGINSTDVFQGDFDPSITAAVHIKPVPGLRIGASYFYNHLAKNGAGAHSGHSIATNTDPNAYKGPVEFNLLSSSISWFGKRYEFLNEFSFNQTKTESQGAANNFSNFSYAGVRLDDKNIPFALVDYIHIAENDLHTIPTEMLKAGIGYRYEFSYLVNLKAQIEYSRVKQSDIHVMHGHSGFSEVWGFRVQLAYGF